MIGKVSPEDLAAHVFGKTGAPDDSVIQGPAYGEDAAAIAVPEGTLVVNSDPISLAVGHVGTLGINVACNDVAASGAEPAWLTVMIFLPASADDGRVLEEVTTQLHETAIDRDVTIVGGHSEYNPALERPLLSLTCMGMADRFVPTGGATPGDHVILTKGAGIEGTAILATDFADDLRAAGVEDTVIERASTFYDDLGVTTESRAVRDVATAMHDPTEGGLIDGLFELASASDVSLQIDTDAIPIRPETVAVTDAVDADPLQIFGSGALAATVPEDAVSGVLDSLAAADIEAADIGTVADRGDVPLSLDDRAITEPVRDDLYALWE
ncbi:AIR synthase family protein [Halanaeroarchaeum sulfurireducens]|uniref:Thiamine-monophosphate kinase n=1 Tax=Halanaeroarchaeum sulfurireducens TaxID=1604004 RepID=A0A0F7P999_9EURY|nr:AIR synthase family protein [Halanaeroarchaeum sulfurireducens]AKH97332.1 thiamine-monophosphate kinase [Halanaeroarchaeum sulfurireducens]ALG81734.1 thiamine-monophosphate kinase [Halanaeroarchaeum sulfurireducens]